MAKRSLKNEKLLENVTHDGKKRWKVYLALFIILTGIAVATLISLEILTQDQVDAWVVQVGVTVTALFGLAGTLLAMLNPEKNYTPPEVPSEWETGVPPSEQ